MREQEPPHYTTANSSRPELGVRVIAVWILVGAAAIFALTGAYFWGASNASVTQVDILIPTPEPVIVQVVGEVSAPGVYELNARDRVLTAIEAAGGPTDNADIEKINLAAFVTDGVRIHVPSVPVTPSPTSPRQITTNDSKLPVDLLDNPIQSTETPIRAPGPIDLNVATIDQLISLPGIGETRASQIIDRRNALGGFTTLEQLLEISGIGEKTLESIRPLVIVR